MLVMKGGENEIEMRSTRAFGATVYKLIANIFFQANDRFP